MTAEALVIAMVRVLGSLPVLRWPLAGGILAVLADLSDLLLLDLLDWGGVADYQSFDKWLDQVYQVCFLAVALRWRGVERGVATGLYLFRLVGFVAFELTGNRLILFVVPNVFETWFLAVAVLHAVRPGFSWTPARTVVVLAITTGLKVLHEWAIHVGRVFDSVGALELLELVRRALTGG